MKIQKTKFIKGLISNDHSLDISIPQIAFIGRSNVGKSSVINTITNKKDLAKTSSFPGRTQQVNVFLINESFYLMDLPGYGYAKTSKMMRQNIQELINWYLFNSNYEPQAICLIIYAKIVPTENDLTILRALEQKEQNIVIIANKVDKIKSSESVKKLKKIKELIGQHKIIRFSSTKKTGISEVIKAIEISL